MSFTNQRGGTFIGVIIGLVLGLAVALAVAVIVTKVPVPFIHADGTSRMPIQDAAEAARNQDWKPNAIVSGSGTITPLPDTAVPELEGGAGTAVQDTPPQGADMGADASNSRPAETAETRPIPSASELNDDPLGAMVATRAARTGAVAQNPDAFLYFVQAGAFSSVPDADAQRARLSLLGVQARVTQGGASGRSVYRVRAGPFSDQSTARRVQTQLADNGFDAALVRVQR